ncbi:unnamed protein product, partial [Vitis vinifera]|uniref:Uncharacterized protein n=1 Tax=Vitis vinifera TaxID=29760 RepID=D7T509_VITVI
MPYTSRGTFWNSWTQFSVLTTLNLDFLCTSPSPTLRPNSASSVVSTLQGKIAVQAPIAKRSSMNQDMRFKAFERLSQDISYYALFSSFNFSSAFSATKQWLISFCWKFFVPLCHSELDLNP